MDTEKKPNEQKADQPKQDIGEIVGDLVVSGATLLAHSAAESVVKRVKKVVAKSAPVEAVKKGSEKSEEVGAWHQSREDQESKESFPRNPAQRRAPVRRLQRNHPRKPPGRKPGRNPNS